MDEILPMGAADQEGGKSGGARPELTGWSETYVRSGDKTFRGPRKPGGRYQDSGPIGLPPCPTLVPLPRIQDLRLCDSRCRWDRGKTNSVSGCKMSSKNFCRSRRRSCWRSRAARGFGSMSAPGRASTAMKLRGDSVGAWAWGAPLQPASQHWGLST